MHSPQADPFRLRAAGFLSILDRWMLNMQNRFSAPGGRRVSASSAGAAAKGRHTTAAREFSRLPSGGAAIDTPGLRCRSYARRLSVAADSLSGSTASDFSWGVSYESVAVFRCVGVYKHRAGVHRFIVEETATLVRGRRDCQSRDASCVRVRFGAIRALATGGPSMRGGYRVCRGVFAHGNLRFQPLAVACFRFVRHERGELSDRNNDVNLNHERKCLS